MVAPLKSRALPQFNVLRRARIGLAGPRSFGDRRKLLLRSEGNDAAAAAVATKFRTVVAEQNLYGYQDGTGSIKKDQKKEKK
jgi:hypothetical protein